VAFRIHDLGVTLPSLHGKLAVAAAVPPASLGHYELARYAGLAKKIGFVAN
jgi:hypothetical protein